MIKLNKVQARVKAVTPHAEKHGDENVPALSVRFITSVSAETLDALDGSLRKFFFRKPAKDELVQEELPGVVSNDGQTKVRYPKLGAFGWDEKFTGYTVTVGSGLTATDTEKKIDDVDVSKIVFQPKDGGTLVLTFSCNMQNADAELIGAFGMMLQETIELSIEPPSVPR